MVVKERPRSPLFIMLCISLVHAARREIIHKIHVLKNDSSFPLWKLLNSPLPTLHPWWKICDGFHMQALPSRTLHLKKIVLKRNCSRFYFSLFWKKQLQRKFKLIGNFRRFLQEISQTIVNTCVWTRGAKSCKFSVQQWKTLTACSIWVYRL